VNDVQLAHWVAPLCGVSPIGALDALIEAGLYQVVDWRLRGACLQFVLAWSRPVAVRDIQRLLGLDETGVLGRDDISRINAEPADTFRVRVLAREIDRFAFLAVLKQPVDRLQGVARALELR
jgi:hypothetical protein